MAFSQTNNEMERMGRKRFASGTFLGTAVTTGAVLTGLSRIKAFGAIGAHATVPVSATTRSGGSQTIVFSSGDTGDWWAVGDP